MGCGLGFRLGLGLPLARVIWQGGSKEVEACTVAGRSGESIVREDWRDRTGGSSEGRHAAFERSPSCRLGGRTGDGFDGGRGAHPLCPSMPVAPS